MSRSAFLVLVTLFSCQQNNDTPDDLQAPDSLSMADRLRMAYTKNDSIQKVKAKEYIENADEREATEAVWRERRRMERFAEARDLIEAQFSLWDGSHSGVVEVVKRGLNDPGSFEHLQTSWMRGGGYPRTYIVIMDFTAKNTYGGRMRHVIRCEVEVETGEVAQVFSIE